MTVEEKIEMRDALGELEIAGICEIAAAVQAPRQALPVWFAALINAHCQALMNGTPRTVRWSCVSGRAQYTNFGPDAELIQPFGIRLHGGHTLAVSWLPGDSTYNLEVFRALDYLV